MRKMSCERLLIEGYSKRVKRGESEKISQLGQREERDGMIIVS